MIAPDVQHARDRAADLKRVLADAYDVACDRGFAAVTWPLVPAKLAFAITELREAEGAAHGHPDPGAWVVEVLDYVVRVGGVLVGLHGLDWNVRPAAMTTTCITFQPVEVVLWPLVRHACDAIQSWRDGEQNASRVQYQLERGVATGIAIYEAATQRDAVVALREVVERNRARPMKHGHHEAIA